MSRRTVLEIGSNEKVKRDQHENNSRTKTERSRTGHLGGSSSILDTDCVARSVYNNIIIC